MMHTIPNYLAIKVQDLESNTPILNVAICPNEEYSYIIEHIADNFVRLYGEQVKGEEATMEVYLEAIAEGKVLNSMIGSEDEGLKIEQTGLDILNNIIDILQILVKDHSVSGKYIPDVFYSCYDYAF